MINVVRPSQPTGNRRRRRWGVAGSRWAAAVALLAVSAGCSSITRLGTGSNVPGRLSIGAGGSGVSPVASSSNVAGGTTLTTAAGGVGTSSGSSTGGSISGATGRVAASAPKCSTPLKIGISYSSDLATAAATVGAGNAQQLGSNYGATLQHLYQLGADDLNRRGGAAGCQLQLAFYDFSTTSSQSYDQISQQECTQFAQDDHVFAAVPGIAEQWDFVTCMASYHIPVFVQAGPTEALLIARASDYGTGNLYTPDGLSTDRLGPDIDLLSKFGYFDPGSKVGILMVDDGRGVDQYVVNNLWKPRLAALGIPVASTFSGPDLQAGISSTGPLAQDMNNAVLQFRSQGVNHVLIAPGAGGDTYFFMRSADNQGYYPRIGLDSTDQPSVDALGGPSKSLAGMMVVSWEGLDYATQPSKPPKPGNSPNAARDRCNQLYQAATAAAGIAVEQMYSWCDILNMLAAGLSGAAGHPSAAALQQGINNLGANLQIAGGFGPSRFGPGHYDGGTEARVMEYDPPSSGWVYVSPPEPMP